MGPFAHRYTSIALQKLKSEPWFPSLQKDIDEDDPFLFLRTKVDTLMSLAGGEHVKYPAGQAVPVLFLFDPAGLLGAPPRPTSRAEAVKDASRRFSRANAVLFQQLQKFEARAAIVAACSAALPGLGGRHDLQLRDSRRQTGIQAEGVRRTRGGVRPRR